jgi:hypothetical protein
MSAMPWMKTVTLTTATTVYGLYALIQALDSTVRFPQCCKLQIQSDPSMGAAKLRIGNSDITSTNCGVSLTAGQALVFETTEQNLHSLLDIFLLSDTNTHLVNVTFVVH